MKKFVLVIALALMASFGAKAQFYVGGSIHFGTGETLDANGNDAAGVLIAPEFGYVINDKCAVGASIGFTNLLGAAGTTVIEIAPYFRYFLLELGPVDFFLDGQLDIAIASGGGASQTAFGVGVAPGIAIPVSDHLSFVGHVGRLGYYNNSFVVEATPSNMQMGLYYSF